MANNSIKINDIPLSNTVSLTSKLLAVDTNLNFVELIEISNMLKLSNSAASLESNNALALANLAFTTAIIAYNSSNVSIFTSNAAFTTANAAFTTANAAFTTANAAFTTANTIYSFANTISISTDSAYKTANLAYNAANLALQIANSANGGGGGGGGNTISVTDDISSNVLYYVGMVSINVGNVSSAYVSSSKLNFNPNTGKLFTNGIDVYNTNDTISEITIRNDIDGTLQLYTNNSTSVIGTVDTTALILQANSTPKFYIDPYTGYIGINTLSPSRNFEVNGDVSANGYYSLSDETLKENVTSLINCLDTVKKLEQVEFDWKNSEKHSYGLIAQDVEKIIPSIVSDNKGIKSIEYQTLIAFLIGSIKEINERLENLENR